MTGRELIEYIQLNHLEECECVIGVHGHTYPVEDAWQTCGEPKLIQILPAEYDQ